MATLTVTSAFGSYSVGQSITDAATVAAILAGPNAIRVVQVADGTSTSPGSTSPGTTPTTPATGSGLTLADVDGEIASAFVAKGVPAGQTVPALITAAIAAQGSGQGISAAQAAALSIVLG